MFQSFLNDPLSALIALIMGGIVVLLGFIFLYIWIRELRDARATRSWPVTTGRVLHSRLNSYDAYFRSTHTYKKEYNPTVEYEYTVNGTTYQSHRIAVGVNISTNSRKDAKRKLAPYHAGMAVQVFYDPADPQQAVLEHGIISGAAFFILSMLMFFLLAAFFLPWNQIIPRIVGAL